jgi:hypothetical protein
MDDASTGYSLAHDIMILQDTSSGSRADLFRYPPHLELSLNSRSTHRSSTIEKPTGPPTVDSAHGIGCAMKDRKVTE